MARPLVRRSPLSYRPPSGPGPAFLQRAGAPAALAYLGSLALVAFVFSSPIVLCAAGLGVVIAGLGSGARSALLLAVKYAPPLAILMIAINVLVSDRGDTVLIHGFRLPVLGMTNVTLESIAAGGVIALRVVVVLAAFAVMSACVDPDEVLRMIRPLARRSAMTAALIGRMVPIAAADHMRLREAAELRGPAASPATRTALARRLVAGALDRSLDSAATLELRGYSLPSTGSRRRAPRGRGAGVLVATGAAIATVSVAGAFAGIGEFSPYPSVEMGTHAGDLALARAIPLLASMPVTLAYRRRAGARRSASTYSSHGVARA
jgi:energy-coupling factor transporter transmembrane protein EcfT